MSTFSEALKTELPQCVVVIPGDAHYDRISASWNIRASFHPQVIVQVTSAEDVSTVIRLAHNHGIRQINARSGGHSFEGQSLGCGNSEAVIIDVCNLQDISIDTEKQIATVGSGVLLGKIALESFEHGRLMTPMGMCVTVGVGGQSQAGGYGFYSRTYGTFVNKVVEYEVVIADGKIIVANAQTNSDLLWALRGSGTGSFGVITKLKIQLNKAPQYSALFSLAYYVKDINFVEVFTKIQMYLIESPYIVNPVMAIWKGELELAGTILCDDGQEFDNALKILDSFSPEPVKKSIHKVDFIDTVVQMGLHQTSAPYNPSLKTLHREKDENLRWMKIKAGFMPAALPLKSIEKLAQVVADQNPVGTRIQILGLNPRMDVDKTKNCIKGQGCPLLMGMSIWIEAGGTDKKSIQFAIGEGQSRVPWLNKAYEVFYPHTTGGYIGDDDRDESAHGRDLLESYYGSHLEKLKEIKRKYDPTNLFHNPFSVPV